MADKIIKFLSKLSPKEQIIANATIAKIVARELEGLQIKSLIGFDNYFRIRKGRIRIIYKDDGENKPRIVRIANRDEKTYKGL